MGKRARQRSSKQISSAGIATLIIAVGPVILACVTRFREIVFSPVARSAGGIEFCARGELGGLPALITNDRAEELALGISMEIEKDAQTQRYSLRIQLRGPLYVIAQKMLHQSHGPIAYNSIESHGGDVRYHENGGVISFCMVHRFRLGREAGRLPQLSGRRARRPNRQTEQSA